MFEDLSPLPYLEEQRLAAIEKLGTHWVLHPQNHVAKLKEPLPEVFKWEPKVLRRGKK